MSLEDLESAEMRLISWRFFSRSDPSGVLLNLGLRVWVRERKYSIKSGWAIRWARSGEKESTMMAVAISRPRSQPPRATR